MTSRQLGHDPALVASSRNGWILLTLLVLAYLVVQSLYLRPPIISDQLDYFHAAWRLPEVTPSHRHLRIGLLLPVRLGISLFGYSEAGYYLVPYLSGAAFLGATYSLGRVLFGPAVGAAAGLLGVFNPYFLTKSSELLPDLPAAACLTGAVALTISVGRSPPWGRADALKLAAAGLLLGWAYLIRDAVAVLFFPIVPVVFLIYRIPWRRIVWVGLSALAVFAIELGWGLAVYGNPVIRLATLLGRRQRPSGLAIRAAARAESDFLTDTLLVFPRILLNWEVGPLFLGLAVVLALAWLTSRERRLGALLAWTAMIWIPLTAIGLLGDPGGVPTLRIGIPRYWFPIYPPLIAGGLGGLGIFISHLTGGRRIMAVALSVALTVAALGLGMQDVEAASSRVFIDDHAPYRELRDWLASDGRSWDALWTDELTSRLVPVYTRATFGAKVWQGEVRSVERGRSLVTLDELGDALVLINSGSVMTLIELERPVPNYLIQPPGSWLPLWASRGGGLSLYEASQ